MTAIELIAAERLRQISEEGYSRDHDDRHIAGELAAAAACYSAGREVSDIEGVDEVWPWEGNVDDALAGKTRRRQLVIAGALIVAEIERLDRAAERDRRANSDPEKEEREDLLDRLTRSLRHLEQIEVVTGTLMLCGLKERQVVEEFARAHGFAVTFNDGNAVFSSARDQAVV